MVKKKKKKRIFPIKIDKEIKYTDTKFLRLFLTTQGKILPRRVTGITIQQQRKIAKAVKRARVLALLPFVTSDIDQNG